MRAYAPVHVTELQDLLQSVNSDNPTDAIKRAAATLNGIVNPPNGRASGGRRILTSTRSPRLGFPIGESEKELYEKTLNDLEECCVSAAPPKPKAKATADKPKAGDKDAEKPKTTDRAADRGPVAVGAAQQQMNEDQVRGSLDISMEDVFQVVQVIISLIRGFRNRQGA